MSMKILSVTLILLSLCLCAASVPSMPRHGGKPIAPCCSRCTESNVSYMVRGNVYREQSAHLGLGCVHAILFYSDNGQICANPNDEWVKKLTATMTKA